MLKTRIRTGAGIFLGLFVLLAFSDVAWFLKLAVATLSLVSVFELYRATGAGKNQRFLTISCICALLLSVWDVPHYDILVGGCFVVALFLFAWLMGEIGSASSIGNGTSAVLATIIVIFYHAMLPLRAMDGGLSLLALAILVCNVCDIAAYLIGCKFGHKKIAPTISPNKTLAGSIGGIITTVVVFSLIACILDATEVLTISYGKLTLYLISASIVSEFGDLSFSAIKRITDIKDYGKILPGHGGFLDRFDSLLLVLPYTYLFVQIAGSFLA